MKIAENLFNAVKSDEKKPLTVELPLEMLIEFRVAARILHMRSSTAMLHEFVGKAIDDAKEKVSKEEFERMVAEQRRLTEERSKSRRAGFEKTFLPVAADNGKSDKILVSTERSEHVAMDKGAVQPDEKPAVTKRSNRNVRKR